MAADAGSGERASAGEIVVERLFSAPRDLVFEAWTVPEHFARWFGPRGVEIAIDRLDARPGGAIQFSHRFETGDRLWVRGTFREVVPPSRLVFVVSFADAEGRPAAHPMFADWPLDAVLTTIVTLEDRAGSTKLTLRQVLTPAEALALESVKRERTLARAGWDECLGRLDETLSQLEGKR
jgi:uncharacterized protein YndB with AHSA1/START domain